MRAAVPSRTVPKGATAPKGEPLRVVVFQLKGTREYRDAFRDYCRAIGMKSSFVAQDAIDQYFRRRKMEMPSRLGKRQGEDRRIRK